MNSNSFKTKSVVLLLTLALGTSSFAMDVMEYNFADLEAGPAVALNPAEFQRRLIISLGFVAASFAFGAGYMYWEPSSVPRGKGLHKIALGAVNGKWVAAEKGGGSYLIANRSLIGSWETYGLLCHTDDCGDVSLQVDNGKWVSAESGGSVLVNAERDKVQHWERFTLHDHGKGKIALQTAHGYYLAVEKSGLIAAYQKELNDKALFVLKAVE